MDLPNEIRVGERAFPVLFFPAKGKSSSVRLKNGQVVIRLSRYVRNYEKDEMIGEFLQWAESKLGELRCDDFVSPDYRDGRSIVLHNKIYELNVYKSLNGRSRAKLNGNVLELYMDQPNDMGKLKEMAEKAIIKDQTDYLEEIMIELNQLYFKQNYNKVRFKRIGSRFGSCSSTRNITIAFRLLFAPKEVFRYVCIHELAHLREFNHSSKFWALVEEAMPDYKKHEKWLKDNGFLLG